METIHLLEPDFLFVEPLPQEARRITVIKNVPPSLQFDFELGDRERPSPQALHQAPLEIEETLQPPGVLRHRILAAQLAAIARKPVRISLLAFFRSGALMRERNRRDRFLRGCSVGAFNCVVAHKFCGFEEYIYGW